MLSRRIRGLAVAAVVGVVALAGTVATAQDFGGGGRGGFGGGGMMGGGGLNSRDLDRYQDMLSLTRDQRDTVKALFEGYQEQSRNLGEDMRDKMQEMRDQMRDGDASVRRGFADAMTSFRKQREKMDASFFSDVQAILTPEQSALWPKVERTRRREQSIGRGFMSGERADVIKILEQENLPADVKAKLQPVLDQYEIDLDRELAARTKLFDENMAKVMEVMAGANGDPTQIGDKLQGVLTQTREASVRVREVNRKAARQVEELLPEDKKAVFAEAFKVASFPNVYRPTQAGRQITAAAGFADLTEEQRTAIAAMKESHARETAALEAQLATATEEQEMTITADQLARRFGGGMMMGQRGGQGGPGGGGQGGQGGGGRGGNQADGGQRGNRGGQGGGGGQRGGQGGGGPQGGGPGGGRGQETGPVADLRQKLRDLDRSTQESLKKVLRPEQVDRLPEPDRGGDRGGNTDPRQRRRDQLNRT